MLRIQVLEKSEDCRENAVERKTKYHLYAVIIHGPGDVSEEFPIEVTANEFDNFAVGKVYEFVPRFE
jgi:hypothetical protein